jgi:hypothetical protein
MNKSLIALACAAMLASSAAMAIGDGWDMTGGGTANNTNVYAGAVWSWDGGYVPDLVIGVFNTRVQVGGNTPPHLTLVI